MDDPLQVLHDELVLNRATDAHQVLASCARTTPPGSVTLFFLDEERRICDLLCVTDGRENVRSLVDMICPFVEARYLLIVSNRSGQVLADRPDDELTWMELVGAASDHGQQLLDWFIVWGTYAFSVAEFAPLGAAW